MKRIKFLLATLLGLTLITAANAAALDQKNVAADAKWLLHADLDGLRASKVGSVLFQILMAGPLKDAKQKVSEELGIELDFNKVRSITAYGPDFKTEADHNGIIMIQAGQDLGPALEALLKQPKNEVKITKSTKGDINLYFVNDEFHVSPFPGNILAMGRTAESVLAAHNVISGKAANLASRNGFSGYSNEIKPVLLIQAEGFNKQEQIPQAAQFLKASDGLKLAIGEAEKHLRLDLDLKTPDKESSDQLGQAVNGMLALFRLNQEDEDLTRLLNATQVKTTDTMVSVNISFPIEQALKKLSEIQEAGE